MKKVIMGLLFFGCFCLTSGCAPKKNPPPQPRPVQSKKPQANGQGFIAKHDTNRDGLVSRAEFPGPDHVFQQLDVNNDGFVDAKEAPTRRGQVRPPQAKPPVNGPKRGENTFIAKHDANRDGRVSRVEFPGPDYVFDQFDRNNDGFIDLAEAPTHAPGAPQRR